MTDLLGKTLSCVWFSGNTTPISNFSFQVELTPRHSLSPGNKGFLNYIQFKGSLPLLFPLILPLFIVLSW